MCLFATLIKNRKYTANKKNGGNVPPVTDERVKYVPVGCGECIECRKQKSRNWQIRLSEEIKENTNGKFITLTFSNEGLTEVVNMVENKEAKGYDLDNEIATRAMRLFNERWRKKYKKALRHWLVTELGHNGTENIHMHGIIWTNETYETIAKIWKYGYIWPRPDLYKKTYVNAQTINYIIKYVSKIDKDHLFYKSLILTSPGMGAGYTKSPDFQKNKYNGEQTIETYRTSTGHKISLPIYYRNKAYNDQEKEKLWVHRLDKNERWICGEKVKADDDKAYWNKIKWHRQRNQELGYGTGEKSWNREQYEQRKRELLQLKRINDATKNIEKGRNTTNTTKPRRSAKQEQNGTTSNTTPT